MSLYYGYVQSLFRKNNVAVTGDRAFSTSGPTLDLVFAGQPTEGYTTLSQTGSINLNFVGQSYKVATSYMVWE
jgi:hypothetical protein